MPPTITGVHLVGSIPCSNTEEALRTVSSALPNHLRRIPDGETGVRCNFATWQAPKLGQWPLFLNLVIRGFFKGLDTEPPPFTEEEKQAVLRDMEERLETDYDVVALESYEIFKMLKAEGVIGDGVRFLVALPTPLTITVLYARTEFVAEFEQIYERAILRALGRIQDLIPSRELSIQWDAPLEMGMVEGIELQGRHAEKWWKEGMVEGVVARFARLCENVQEGVDLGVHLCYGDMRGKHFIEPKDTGALVDVAVRLLDRSKRNIDFIHMPVPKDRTDDQYFEALKGLSQFVQDGNELCLGLLHPKDPEGTRERIRAAGKFVSAFSVSSECGLGRKTREELSSVLDIASAVSSPVESKI